MEETFYLSRKTNLKDNNIWKIASGEDDDYTTGCLLHYPYVKKYYKLIAIDLSKKQKVHADPRAIYFYFYYKVVLLKILIELEMHKCSLLIKKVEETVLDFSKRTVEVLRFYFVLI